MAFCLLIDLLTTATWLLPHSKSTSVAAEESISSASAIDESYSSSS